MEESKPNLVCPDCAAELTLSDRCTPEVCPVCGCPLAVRAKVSTCVAVDDHGNAAASAPGAADELLAARLRRAFEYQTDALASADSCVLAGGSSAAFVRTGHSAGLPPSTRLGDFEVLEELGRGGMGIVYRARQVSLGREVALKVLPGYARHGPSAVQRFKAEAEAAARLHHTNVVSIYAQGEHEGQYYYAMELIEGVNLDSLMRPQPLEPRRLAGMLAEVADALQCAHERGVIHRDVKPHNLLLGNAGRLHLTDFGLARLAEEPHLTVNGEVMGTPAYLSPEQVRGVPEKIDERTDVYSLGVTLYEALTGRRPFRGETRDQIMNQITSAELLPPRKLRPDIPAELETVCLRALEKDPTRRHQTAGELGDDLRRFADGRPIRSRRPGPLARGVRWINRHRSVTGGALAAIVILALAGGWLMTERADRKREAQQLTRRAYEQLAYVDYRAPGLVQEDLDRAEALDGTADELHLARALAALGSVKQQEALPHLDASLAADPQDQRALPTLLGALEKRRPG